MILPTTISRANKSYPATLELSCPAYGVYMSCKEKDKGKKEVDRLPSVGVTILISAAAGALFYFTPLAFYYFLFFAVAYHTHTHALNLLCCQLRFHIILGLIYYTHLLVAHTSSDRYHTALNTNESIIRSYTVLLVLEYRLGGIALLANATFPHLLTRQIYPVINIK